MKRSEYLTIEYSHPMKWVNIRRYYTLTLTGQVNIRYYIYSHSREIGQYLML